MNPKRKIATKKRIILLIKFRGIGGFFGRHKGFGVFARTNSTDEMDENHYIMNELEGNALNKKNFFNHAKICSRNIA